MQILVEGKTPSDMATRTQLDAWIATIKLPYTAALNEADPNFELETYFNVPRDQFIIVDLRTMKLVDVLDADPMGAIAEVEGLVGGRDGGTPDL